MENSSSNNIKHKVFDIYKFTYKGDDYKVLVKCTEEKWNSHIYPIYKNDDTSIESLGFYIGNIDDMILKNIVSNFTLCDKLTDEDYEILSKKWKFVKMFQDKTVNIRDLSNLGENKYFHIERHI